jgi:hypothetical protein
LSCTNVVFFVNRFERKKIIEMKSSKRQSVIGARRKALAQGERNAKRETNEKREGQGEGEEDDARVEEGRARNKSKKEAKRKERSDPRWKAKTTTTTNKQYRFNPTQ